MRRPPLAGAAHGCDRVMHMLSTGVIHRRFFKITCVCSPCPPVVNPVGNLCVTLDTYLRSSCAASFLSAQHQCADCGPRRALARLSRPQVGAGAGALPLSVGHILSESLPYGYVCRRGPARARGAFPCHLL